MFEVLHNVYYPNYHPACRSHEQVFDTENIKWHIFLDFSCCCNANMYSRMADKLSKGNNSSTFIGMQGKPMETAILREKKTTKRNKNTSNQITFENKNLC